jgi:hypothetical protein
MIMNVIGLERAKNERKNIFFSPCSRASYSSKKYVGTNLFNNNN